MTSIQNQRGETLIEVIVATLVFAIGILGNMGLQSASVMNNKSSLHQTKAILAANDIAEKIRANRTAALDGAYNGYDSTTPPANPGCATSPCTELAVARYHLFDWSHNFSNVYGDSGFVSLLPAGAAAVTYDAANSEYNIEIQWTEQAYKDAEGGATKTNRTRTHQLVLVI